MSVESIFVTYAADQFTVLLNRLDTCLGKLTPEQIWSRNHESANAIGNLVLHLCGNVRQWILSGIGGEPDVRIRDAEFSTRGGRSTDELRALLRSTVEAAVALIRSLPPERLSEIVTPQNSRLTVLEDVFHVIEHFSGHTGQVIFLTKLLTGEDLGFYSHFGSPKPPGRN